MLNWIYSQILCPNCLKCGSMFVGPSFFCELCREPSLQSMSLYKYRRISEEKVFCLFDWKNDPQLISKQIVTLLKSALSRNSWIFYSTLFKKKFSHKHKIAIVPIPGSSWASFHTTYFSQALALQLRALVVPALLKPQADNQQKHKSRLERSEIFIELNEKFTKEIQSADLVILVDDILTTGSTFKAAISQLKPCLGPNAELFSLCLFSRSSKTTETEIEDSIEGE